MATNVFKVMRQNLTRLYNSRNPATPTSRLESVGTWLPTAPSTAVPLVMTSLLILHRSTDMSGQGEKDCLALIAARDPQIPSLLKQGLEFVTNTLKAGIAPIGIKAKADREQVRRLRQEVYQVAVNTAYDEQGELHPTLNGIWWKKR